MRERVIFLAVYQNLNHHHTAENNLPNLCENHPLVVPNKTNDQEIERRKKQPYLSRIFFFSNKETLMKKE